MRRRNLIVTLAAAALLAGCAEMRPFFQQPANRVPDLLNGTLIVLRHTEREGEDLTPAGWIRAAALPEALAGIEIDGIYAPDTQRNIDTARPLAEARGLEVQIIPAVDIARTMFARQPGGTLVWIGNKANLAGLWEEIAAAGDPPILYGDLFIVPMNGLRAARVERSRFGG